MSHWGSPTETPTGICSSDGSRGGESFTPVVRLADGRAVAAAESDIVSVQCRGRCSPGQDVNLLSCLGWHRDGGGGSE